MSALFWQSPFPQGRLSQIWEYLINHLRNDARLRSAVDDWHIRDGTLEDRQPADAGKVELGLTTSGGALRWTDETRHGGEWNIDVDFILPTTEETHALDAWECLYNAMPWPYLHQDLVLLGCFGIVMIGPALTRQESESGESMKISGVIQLLINVDEYPA